MANTELKKIYESACSQDAASIYELGLLFSKEDALERIIPIAIEKFVIAARMKYEPAYETLFNLYKENPSDFDGIMTYEELIGLIDSSETLREKYAMEVAKASKDEDKIRSLYEKAASFGNPEASCRIGYECLFGKDRKDYDKALVNLNAAKEANIPMAFFCLGYMYLNGVGVEKNENVAIDYLKRASEGGVLKASEALAYYYYYGSKNTERSFASAKLYFERLAVWDKRYNVMLSKCMMYGEGASKNVVRALEVAKKASECGDREAVINYAILMIEAEQYTGVVNLLEKLANANDAEAEYITGFCYANGLGVNEDVKIAKDWLQKSAGHGYSLADAMLKVL